MTKSIVIFFAHVYSENIGMQHKKRLLSNQVMQKKSFKKSIHTQIQVKFKKKKLLPCQVRC